MSECGAWYGTGDGQGAAICRRHEGHPPISEDGVGHSPYPDHHAGVVFTQVHGVRWCVSHWSPMIPGMYEPESHCMVATWGEPEEERCVPVPLYVEAPDP